MPALQVNLASAMFLDAPNSMQRIVWHVKFALCIATVTQKNEFALPVSHRSLVHWVSPAGLLYALADYVHCLPLALAQIVHVMWLVKAVLFSKISSLKNLFLLYRLGKAHQRMRGRTLLSATGCAVLNSTEKHFATDDAVLQSDGGALQWAPGTYREM